MPKPDITLTDQDGHRFALKPRTQGKVTLVYFGYTHCPDVCPLTMSMLAGAVKALPATAARDVAVVFVTTDPARDTPTRLKQWLANFDSSFVGLTGSNAAVAGAQRQVGSPPSVTEPDGKGGYGVDHGAFIYAYSPDDRAHIVYFSGVQPAALAADLRRLTTGAVPSAT
jgi:protein SCO1